MPLIPTAKPAIADRDRRAVLFVMKDGTKPISILVSNPALENIEIAPPVDEGYFFTFKLYRRSFEKIEPQVRHGLRRARRQRVHPGDGRAARKHKLTLPTHPWRHREASR